MMDGLQKKEHKVQGEVHNRRNNNTHPACVGVFKRAVVVRTPRLHLRRGQQVGNLGPELLSPVFFIIIIALALVVASAVKKTSSPKGPPWRPPCVLRVAGATQAGRGGAGGKRRAPDALDARRPAGEPHLPRGRSSPGPRRGRRRDGGQGQRGERRRHAHSQPARRDASTAAAESEACIAAKHPAAGPMEQRSPLAGCEGGRSDDGGRRHAGPAAAARANPAGRMPHSAAPRRLPSEAFPATIAPGGWPTGESLAGRRTRARARGRPDALSGRGAARGGHGRPARGGRSPALGRGRGGGRPGSGGGDDDDA